MPHPRRNNIYMATIKRMVNEALEAQEQEFTANRGADSDEQLLIYLRQCSATLRHTPWPREIIGGNLIERRFGTWQAALCLAKLPLPNTPDKITVFIRYQEETERQKVIYRERKAEKKIRAQKRMAEQARKQKEHPEATKKETDVSTCCGGRIKYA